MHEYDWLVYIAGPHRINYFLIWSVGLEGAGSDLLATWAGGCSCVLFNICPLFPQSLGPVTHGFCINSGIMNIIIGLL